MENCLLKVKSHFSDSPHARRLAGKFTFLIALFSIVCSDAFAQQLIKGKITDANGVVAGATIQVKGTPTATESDKNGNFSINAAGDAILVFSSVGYTSMEVAVNNRTSMSIVLQSANNRLGEVVVVGYGTVRKSDLTGSVTSVKAADLKRTPASNLIAALQGQAAGVNIQQRSGNPGQNPLIRIRGANSLSIGANDPLYVVDGMLLTGIGNDLNMDEVESVEILKDASATAIYGSRGANGVVIISTKKGINGKPQVTYDAYVGVQKIIKKLDFLNATEYKDFYVQSRKNATIATTIDTSITNSTANTDWADEVYRQALIQNHTVSVRGGTDKSRYFTSFNYFNQDGIIRNTDFSRASLRYNGEHVLSSRFNFTENLLLSYTKTNGVFGDEVVSNGIAWARPTMPVLDASGKPSFVALPFPRSNPKTLVEDVVNQGLGYRLIGNIVFDYAIANGLTAKVNLGTEDNFQVGNSYVPKTLTESSFKGSASKSTSVTTSWIDENTLNYSKVIATNHRIDAFAGVTFQQTNSDYVSGSSTGYITDGFQYNNLGAGTTQSSSSKTSKYSLVSYLGRVNYAFMDKWLLTFSGRYDGSSRLSEGNKYAFFPSGAIAWKMSEENFMKNMETISELKLRGSFGKTGNQTVAPYSSFATLATVNVYPSGGTSPTIGYVPATVANQNLTWETTDQLDFGVDLGILHNRIQFTADYYKKNTTGLLFKRQTPPTSGYSNAIQNIGEVENKGTEFFVRSVNLLNPLRWTTSLNVSMNRAKVIDLGKNPAGEPVTQIFTDEGYNWFPIIVGQVPFSAWGYVVDKVDKTTGAYTFKDLNKDGTVDAKDQQIIGNFQPKYIFGLTNDFIYKNFDFSFFIQGSQGNQVFIDAFRYSLALNGNNNILKSVYNGMGTTYPRPNADYGYSGGQSQNSSALIFDGSYVRLKAITLGYTFPAVFSKSSSLRLYVTGTNLFTIDNNYPWYDPEVSAGNDLINGWDRGGYANNKSVIVGLKVNF
jgi:TonB-dependent starch-binding outer membrane protein SusC